MLAAVLASIALMVGIRFYFASRVITVWVYTDFTFRDKHPEWPGLVQSRFDEVNRIYQANGTGILWKVLDSSQLDPTRNIPGLDTRRANMALHFDRPCDVYVLLTDVHEGDRTGTVHPFTRVAVIVDYPDKSESLNARLMARELAHLFGVPRDPAWFSILMSEKPESSQFSPRSIAVIKRMRNYPFALGIDALSQSSWEKRALDAVSKDDVAAHANPMGHAHTIVGTSLIDERKNDAALAHFRAAVAADPQNKTMRLNLAEVYTRTGQYELALDQAREAVRLAPNDGLAHRALGALLGRNRQPEAALQELQTAIRLDPNNVENQVLLGYEYAGMFGHLDDAVAALQEAARVDPGSHAAQRGLQTAEFLKARVESEIVRQRKLIEVNPNDPDAHYRLAKVEARAGDLKGAIRDFQKAAELRPDNGSPHAELAELYMVQGDTEAAWAEIRKARALGTEPSQSLLARLPAQK